MMLRLDPWSRRQVDRGHAEPRIGQCPRVQPRAAADLEEARARRQERDDEPHLGPPRRVEVRVEAAHARDRRVVASTARKAATSDALRPATPDAAAAITPCAGTKSRATPMAVARPIPWQAASSPTRPRHTSADDNAAMPSVPTK